MEREALRGRSGPLAGFTVGALIFTFAGHPNLYLDNWHWFLRRIALWATVGWSILNLLPILPLDGGQLLLGLLSAGRVAQSERIVLAISTVVAGVGVIAAAINGLDTTALMAAGLCYLSASGLSGNWKMHPATMSGRGDTG